MGGSFACPRRTINPEPVHKPVPAYKPVPVNFTNYPSEEEADFDLFVPEPSVEQALRGSRAAGVGGRADRALANWLRVTRLARRLGFKRKEWHNLGQLLKEIKARGRDGECKQYGARRSR